MNTVTIPVIRNAHHAQFLATPFSRTIPVTRLGVSAEKVQATIEIPKSHHGIPRPPRKNCVVSLPAVLDAIHPIERTTTKNIPTIVQSSEFNAIFF
jgi:hypothetical protein